jgi:eukaryotic-like serine/threonine-protein kinase
MPMRNLNEPALLGRYAIYDEIASGGMATVHYGRLLGAEGFARIVAIKRLHPHFAKDESFVSMFLDEARLAARVHHPNVVGTIDVVSTDGELMLVMEYVHGESLSRLARACSEQGTTIPLDILGAIMSGVLHGLHAAHEASSEAGEPLGIVHRDVSPQNILIGVDGVARVLDFGIAKAAGRSQVTREGVLKGKLSYMAPEQVRRFEVTRAADVYACGVVLWEMLTLQRLFTGDNEAILIFQVIEAAISPPSMLVPTLLPGIDELVLKALARNPEQRHPTAEALALEVEATLGVASPTAVRRWLSSIAGPELEKRARHVAQIEAVPQPSAAPPPPEPAPPAPVVVAETPGPRRVVRLSVIVAAILAAALAAAILLVRARTPDLPTLPAPSAADSSAETPSQTATASAVASDSTQAPVASAQPPAAASASARRPPAGGKSIAPPPSRCDPPYRLDASGRRKWKPECM